MNDALFAWTSNTRLVLPPNTPACVRCAAELLERDMAKTLSPGGAAGSSSIELFWAEPGDELFGGLEQYRIDFGSSGGEAINRLLMTGSDELGLVYGLLHLSEAYLGVDPFWFWMDAEPSAKGVVSIPAKTARSKPFAVRYRGWFVNDEDSIIGWTDSYPPPREAWFPVFEALLRSGGNMVIPGTDLPRFGCHRDLANEMGLFVAQHHAEPLGAEMFKRAHPDLEARYDLYPDLFAALWENSVRDSLGRKTVWTLGFRGQGDCPFWEQSPAYDTDRKRGDLISDVIARQREILRCADAAAPCCVYIYGELTELYRGGYLKLPDDAIKIWADNGYGRMVSRRRGNENPRTASLPDRGDTGAHGVYYHVAFHDLQASNHLTMFPNDPTLIRDELRAAFDRGARAFLLVNSANIRHQTCALDLVAEFWRSGDADLERQRTAFCERFFPSSTAAAYDCLRAYPEATVRYGPHDDDRAGEEFYHHCPRSLAAAWMRGATAAGAADMRWATGPVSLAEQFNWFRARLKESLPAWEKLATAAAAAAAGMVPPDAERFRSYFGFQVEQQLTGCSGFLALCEAYELFTAADYPRAFVTVSQSLEWYRRCALSLEAAQKGKWCNFFRVDYLTNIGATVYAVDTLRRWLRQFGDAPDYFRWNRAYAVDARERGVYLENTTRRVLGDDELAAALSRALGKSG